MRVLLLLVVLLGAGCSSIPPGGDPALHPEVKERAARERERAGSVAVAPVRTVTLAKDELAKGWRPSETAVIDADAMRAELVRAVEATGGFERVHAGADEPGHAWRDRDDLVVDLAIEDVRTRYEGRNGWWIPNIANWIFWIVPSWWVATEEYAVSLQARVTVTSGESGALIATRTIPVEVRGSFDEFDRGWQFFGFIYSSLDAEGWRGIATKLFPAARREALARAALAMDDLTHGAAESASIDEARRKTLVLAIGVSRHRDAVLLPPLPYAAADAQRVADAFARRGLAADHVVVLADDAATLDGVRGAVADHLGRAREQDTVVLSFSGYGTRAQDGAPCLVLHDGERLTLDALAAILPERGDKLVLLDASFSGDDRSVRGGPTREADDLAALASVPRLAALVASGPSEGALAPEYLGAGLFTYHVARALTDPEDGLGGRAGARAVLDAARPRVVAEAALFGRAQTPRGCGLDQVELPAASN